ncbi:MAG: ferrous iron transport protein B [Endomicrobium sp.]|jgi:ferrous iron transport protein B|nr:ferrous iron transport protein B [Endomicrobium sp.]
MANDKILNIAIAGNPNIGKSTIFNAFTGSNQHVGNYPGITVEKKESLKVYKDIRINFIDLPGVYSLSAYSDDEVATRNFLLENKADVIINVIDASNLERNLYLFTHLAELNIPIIVVLNMSDILKAQGKIVDIKEMEALLGVPVFNTIANKAIGIAEILDYLVGYFKNDKLKHQTRATVDYGQDLNTEVDKIESIIIKSKDLSKFPSRWFSIQLLDNDPIALGIVEKSENAIETLEQLGQSKSHLKNHFGEKLETEFIDKRYGFANSVVKTVIKKVYRQKIDISEIIDTFALNKYLGIPIFALVMYAIFKFTFSFSVPFVKIFELFFSKLGQLATSILPYGPIESLIVDGIIGGVGGVLGFFPLVLFMFLAIAFFEDSGYMARAAFVMDKTMSKFGLHGKSFLPLMLATNGCAVPGILATRTLHSKRDRFITMFAVPLMICGAKLPVFALIIGAFFPKKYQTVIMFIMYLLSIILALSVTKLLSKTILKGESQYFVMELPPYHLPTLKGLFLKMWERGWMYVRKAGTVIVFVSILVWFVFEYPKAPVNKNLSKSTQAAVQLKYSFAGKAGEYIEPIFKPIGMDGNRAIALLAGLAAKEVIVSTLGTFYAIGDDRSSQPLKEKIASDKDWSPLKGITFLIFCLIYMPCIVSVSVFFKEIGSSFKWLALLIVGTTTFAWLASFIVFQLGTLLKIGI